MRNLPTRVLVGIALLVVLVLAGGLSVYASSRPDGLERVAEDQGFAEKAEEHPAADGPLADYELDGGGGTGVAGVIGAVVVLVLATGTTYAVRRRGDG
jgi:PDGLE domain